MALPSAPNKRLHLTPRCVDKVVAILKLGFGPIAFPIHRCAAAQAQAVGLRPIPTHPVLHQICYNAAVIV